MSHHTLLISPAVVCTKMEQLSVRTVSNIIAHTTTPSQWYDLHISSSLLPPLPLAILYEGKLIHRKGEYWLVQNHTKRGFESLTVFRQLGLQEVWAFALKAQEVTSLPDSPLITIQLLSSSSTSAIEEVQSLMKAYVPVVVLDELHFDSNRDNGSNCTFAQDH